MEKGRGIKCEDCGSESQRGKAVRKQASQRKAASGGDAMKMRHMMENPRQSLRCVQYTPSFIANACNGENQRALLPKTVMSHTDNHVTKTTRFEVFERSFF